MSICFKPVANLSSPQPGSVDWRSMLHGWSSPLTITHNNLLEWSFSHPPWPWVWVCEGPSEQGGMLTLKCTVMTSLTYKLNQSPGGLGREATIRVGWPVFLSLSLACAALILSWGNLDKVWVTIGVSLYTHSSEPWAKLLSYTFHPLPNP